MNASLNEKLRKVKWGEFNLGELFDVVSYKKRFDANKVLVYESGEHPYIVRMGSNNGQKGFINEDISYLNDGNTISFGQDTATAFYQEKPYFSGDKIKVLKPKYSRFGKANAQFFLSIMKLAFSKFSWGGSNFDVATIQNVKLTLPVTTDREIDFDFMEAFIAEIEAERFADVSTYLTKNKLADYELTNQDVEALNNLDKIDWSEYRMGDLFEKIQTKKIPYQAKDLPTEPTGNCDLPCLTSSFNNQGLNYYTKREGATILQNVITIPQNSDVYRAYYQSSEFTVLSDAYAIEWRYDDRKLTREQFLFIVMCINKVTDLPIYSHKNKLGGWNVVRKKIISLPQTNGEIDFEFMNQFISAIEKQEIKSIVDFTNNRISENNEAPNC